VLTVLHSINTVKHHILTQGHDTQMPMKSETVGRDIESTMMISNKSPQIESTVHDIRASDKR